MSVTEKENITLKTDLIKDSHNALRYQEHFIVHSFVTNLEPI